MMSRTQLLVKTVGNRACLFAYTASIELFLSTQKGLFRASSATTRMPARDLRRALPRLSGTLYPTNQSPGHSATPGSADNRWRSGRLSLAGTGAAGQSRHPLATDTASAGSRAIGAVRHWCR